MFNAIPNSANTALMFLDLQEQIMKNSRTVSIDRLTRTAGALAKLAVLHQLPTFLSSVGQGGTFLGSVTSQVRDIKPRDRIETTAFSDAGLVAAIKGTNRPVLILSGVASEIVVQRTALDALAAGYAVHIAVDACGGVDARTEEAAWRRIQAAGGTLTSVTTFAAELAGDFTTSKGGSTIGIMYETLGA